MELWDPLSAPFASEKTSSLGHIRISNDLKFKHTSGAQAHFNLLLTTDSSNQGTSLLFKANNWLALLMNGLRILIHRLQLQAFAAISGLNLHSYPPYYKAVLMFDIISWSTDWPTFWREIFFFKVIWNH